MKFLCLLLLYNTVFSQSKPVEIKIDTLTTSTDLYKERSFKLKYTIINRTDKTIYFILNPNALIPIGGGSLNPSVYYKVYEKESSIDANRILSIKTDSKNFKTQREVEKHQDSIRQAFENKSLETIEKERKERLGNNIQELKPNEKKQYQATLLWYKERYFRNDAIEYYISETDKHYFELHINLMKEELISGWSETDKQELLKKKNFVKGWYTSNKVEIDFSE